MDEKSLDKKYEEYIDELIDLIAPLAPNDINELQKNYLLKNMKKSATLFASSMQEELVFQELEFEDQCFYLKVFAEWSFHKEIDLFRSGIPAKYWKIVMQKIWYTTWEVMFACVKNEAPESVVLSLVERFINRTYNDAVDELKQNDLIDEKIEEKAKEQSNVDDMARDIKIGLKLYRKIKYTLIRLFFAVIIAAIVSFIILKFKTAGLVVILTLLLVYHFIPPKREY